MMDTFTAQATSVDNAPIRRPRSSAKLSEAIGDVVLLCLLSRKHNYFTLCDLERLVIPPIKLGQYRIFYSPERAIGAALWAFVSDDVASRLSQAGTQLTYPEWTSGHNLWLVDLIAPFGDGEAMLNDLKATAFPNEQITFVDLSRRQPTRRIL